jgi:hypothetical protein
LADALWFDRNQNFTSWPYDETGWAWGVAVLRMTTMFDQEALNVIARAVVHANAEFRAAGQAAACDEILQINDEGDRVATAILAGLREAGYVVAKS